MHTVFPLVIAVPQLIISLKLMIAPPLMEIFKIIAALE